jgi:hypothetical protein
VCTLIFAFASSSVTASLASWPKAASGLQSRLAHDDLGPCAVWFWWPAQR